MGKSMLILTILTKIRISLTYLHFQILLVHHLLCVSKSLLIMKFLTTFQDKEILFFTFINKNDTRHISRFRLST